MISFSLCRTTLKRAVGYGRKLKLAVMVVMGGERESGQHIKVELSHSFFNSLSEKELFSGDRPISVNYSFICTTRSPVFNYTLFISSPHNLIN